MARTNVRGGQVADNSIVLTPGVGQDVTGVLPVANGGTGSNSIPLNALLVGNGSGTFMVILPGAAGTVLTSNGSVWSAQPATGGGGGTPTYIAPADSYTVKADTQVLYVEEIKVDGDMLVDGVLCELTS